MTYLDKDYLINMTKLAHLKGYGCGCMESNFTFIRYREGPKKRRLMRVEFPAQQCNQKSVGVLYVYHD